MFANFLLVCVATNVLPAEPATIRLLVSPPHTEVWIGEHRVQSVGGERLLITPPLPRGQRFTYVVRARWGTERREWNLPVQAGEHCVLSVSGAEATNGVEDQGVRNFGVVRDQLAELPPREEIRLNDRPITRAEAARLLRNQPLPDDSGKLRLTIIGPEGERRRVRDDLDQPGGPLADLAGTLLVQDYPADHWAVVGAGFHTGGKPTIYVQQADGRVLHRQDDYADGPAGLRRALEAIRRPNPKYDPARDADLRRPARQIPWDVLIAGGVLLLLTIRLRPKAQ